MVSLACIMANPKCVSFSVNYLLAKYSGQDNGCRSITSTTYFVETSMMFVVGVWAIKTICKHLKYIPLYWYNIILRDWGAQ